jgi:dolichyl-phosphate-mannose-protein mannosyltransferase
MYDKKALVENLLGENDRGSTKSLSHDDSGGAPRPTGPEFSLAPPGRTRVLNWIFNGLILGFLFLALVLLLLWIVPYPKIRVFLDSLAAQHSSDGRVTHPTEGGLHAFIARLPFAFCLLVTCAVGLASFRRRLGDFLVGIPAEWPGILKSVRVLFPPGIETSLEIGAVLTVFGIGVFLRAWHLGRSVRYDEATTYLMYATQHLYRALSNYSYPNNHLFNTLLIHFSLRAFGDNAVALRLPAFIAGGLTIPMSWLAGRALYGRSAGILTAGCVAALPTFIEYSVNARGYALQWVFILAMMCCGVILISNHSLKTSWLAFVAAGVGGIYCIPTMVIPIGSILIWMLVSAVASGGVLQLRVVLKKLAWAGLAMGFLSLLLYLPPLLSSGPSAVLSNRFVISRQTPFFEGLGALAHATWLRWSEGVPTAIIWILTGGIVIGLVFHRKASAFAVPMTVVFWIWSFVFAWARNILGYPRVWNYLLLAAIIAASAGLSLLVRLLVGHSEFRQVVFAGTASVLLTAIVGTCLIRERLLFRNNEGVAMVDTAQVVEFLKAELRPGESLVSNYPVNPIIEYSLLHRDRKLYASLVPPERAERVVAVLPKADVDSDSYRTDELLARLAAQNAVDPALASAQLDLSAFDSPHLLAKFLTVTVYSFERKQKIP